MFNKDNQKICAYCAWGDKFSDGMILCYYYGPTRADQKCRKYRYDPYKRTPQQQPDIKPSGLKPLDGH